MLDKKFVYERNDVITCTSSDIQNPLLFVVQLAFVIMIIGLWCVESIEYYHHSMIMPC